MPVWIWNDLGRNFSRRHRGLQIVLGGVCRDGQERYSGQYARILARLWIALERVVPSPMAEIGCPG